MFRRCSAVALVLASFAPLAAQSRLDADINARIRQEENTHSQIMKTLHVLADVYGPRVTGSPSLKAAGEWAIAQMQYERVIEDDVKASAIAIAATLYQLAMSDKTLPRFAPADMPTPVK
jgi:hypothetical protein